MSKEANSRNQLIDKFSSKNMVLKRLEVIRRHISVWKNKLSHCPPGRLKVKKCGNYSELYISYSKRELETIVPGKGDQIVNRRNVYVSKNSDLARRLAAKAFYEKSIERGENNARQLESLLKNKDLLRTEAVDLLPQDIISLLPPDIVGDNFLDAWIYDKSNAEVLDRYSEDKKYAAADGTLMRSKSEVIIANELIRRGIPFIYEKKIVLPDGNMVHPDFTVPDAFGEREIIIEHFGMMGEQDYADNTIRKINMYYRNGFLPGDNFFAFFESVNVPFDTGNMSSLLDCLEGQFDLCA